MRNDDETTRRVALFKSQYGSTTIWEVGDDPDKTLLNDWVRVSEVLEITVTPLSSKEVLAGQLRAMYAIRASTAAKFADELASIDARIESLRALPAPSDS